MWFIRRTWQAGQVERQLVVQNMHAMFSISRAVADESFTPLQLVAWRSMWARASVNSSWLSIVPRVCKWRFVVGVARPLRHSCAAGRAAASTLPQYKPPR